MALLAVKHLDPVVGVDVHSVLVTPGTPPVFLPHPHVGFMLDKREYIQAAKAVVGCIATMIAQEKLTEYIEDHPEDVKKLEHLAGEANQQVNELMGGGKLPDTVVEGMKLANEANKIKNRISDDLGSNVGSGGSSGRPIFVNGMMRATAGTHAYHVPGLHFPLGESFAPPPEEVEPSNDGESFMGSKTVLANNDPMSYMALEALSCWSIGMEPPPHNSAHTDRTYPSMPSSVMLPIPAGRPVLVGGPPIMNIAAAAKGLFKAFRGSKWAKALADKLHLKSGFLRCNVLKAEPVDVTTGEVIVQQNDFTVSGRLPLVWDRYYASHNSDAGVIGFGWQTPADIRLELIPNENGIGAVAHFPDHATAFNAAPADDGWAARTHDWQHGHALYRDDARMVLRTRKGIEYGFVLPSWWRDTAAALDGDSRLTLPIDRMADLNGNAWVFERDVYGGLVRLVEWKRDGQTERLVECGTDRGLLTSLTLIDAGGNAHPLVSYEHDRERNLAVAIDPMAHPHHFGYTAGHRMVNHTSARGVSFYYSYQQGDDGVWRVDHAWGDNGLFDYRFVYDRARMETCVTNSLGHTMITQMNERGMPVAEIDPLGGVTGYRYDAQGRTSAVIDLAARTTAWEYDAYGNLLVQTLPDGSTVRVQYDDDHRPVCVTAPVARQWRYEWDDRGNLVAQIKPSQAISRYAYDVCGQLISRTGPSGAVTQFEYDRDGNPAGLVDALGNRTQYEHNVRGNVVRVVNALGQVNSYEYDRNSNLIRSIEVGGRELHCIYDADGNLVRYRDPAGNTTQLEYSALGRVCKRIAANGNAVEYRYDTEAQLVGVINEQGDLYTLKRDVMGRVIEEVDYWGQVRRYEYDPRGELRCSIDPLGRATYYQVDKMRRIVQKKVSDPRQTGGFRIETFRYDSSGNLILAENPYSRVELTYDVANRVVEERQNSDFIIAYRYNAAGLCIERRTHHQSARLTAGHTVRYRYDAMGMVISIQIDDALPVIIDRDALGRAHIEHLGDAALREIMYTPEGKMAQQKILTINGDELVTEYAYGLTGEMAEKRDSGFGAEYFEYDPVRKLTGHLDVTGKLHRFLHDPAGNLLKVRDMTMGVPPTQPVQTGASRLEREYEGGKYVFDCIGNLMHKHTAQQDLQLRWDGDGLLIETEALRFAESSEGGEVLNIRTQYEYDALHRRTKKVTRIKSNIDEGRGLTSEKIKTPRIGHYFWAGNMLVGDVVESDAGIDDLTSIESLESKADALDAEEVGCDELNRSTHVCNEVREWVYYPGTFRPLAWIHLEISSNKRKQDVLRFPAAQSDSDKIYYFLNDPNGKPTRVIDQQGLVVWTASDSIWGEVGQNNAPEFDQPLRFLGQYFDEETRLIYNRYRYYDPDFAGYISRDPIGLCGGANLYSYAPNPMNWCDAFGLSGDEDPDLSYAKMWLLHDLKPNEIIREGENPNVIAGVVNRNSWNIEYGTNGFIPSDDDILENDAFRAVINGRGLEKTLTEWDNVLSCGESRAFYKITKKYSDSSIITNAEKGVVDLGHYTFFAWEKDGEIWVPKNACRNCCHIYGSADLASGRDS